MYTEFKHKDLVSPELVYIMHIMLVCLIESRPYVEHNLLNAVNKLMVSRNFRGTTRDCIKARKLTKELKDRAQRVYVSSNHFAKETANSFIRGSKTISILYKITDSSSFKRGE